LDEKKETRMKMFRAVVGIVILLTFCSKVPTEKVKLISQEFECGRPPRGANVTEVTYEWQDDHTLRIYTWATMGVEHTFLKDAMRYTIVNSNITVYLKIRERNLASNEVTPACFIPVKIQLEISGIDRKRTRGYDFSINYLVTDDTGKIRREYEKYRTVTVKQWVSQS
jgi:hypothetical protein